MGAVPPLQALGKRICIIGPSSSGKSTLATALAHRLAIPVFHLDQLAHIPHSNWVRRPNEAFRADHERLLAAENWVIEGNYSFLMPERFTRATSVIWLDPPLSGTLFRYIRRCWKQETARPGRLQGAQREFSWKLIRYTLLSYPKNRVKYRQLLEQYPHLCRLKLTRFGQLKAAYAAWGLSFPVHENGK